MKMSLNGAPLELVPLSNVQCEQLYAKKEAGCRYLAG